ncbi:unnamed protein product [Anisakis simplex]|uniref:CRAL-TRIO domain-containing protein n=1 Tax=Anisakis simplex TaxID=6269 RepID=A0A0M3J721_ANISI|nr:unnamed protein product [Anisakis simplex]
MYPGMVQKIFLVNPPKLVSALWGLVKRFLNDKNCNLVEIVGNNKELLQYLPKSFVPKEFGGDFVNSVPPGDESGMSQRRKITADDHLRSYEVYRKKGIPRAKPNHQDIATKSAFTYVVDVPSGHVLLWDFSANHEVDFMIYVDGNKRELVYPRLRLISTKLPEEGCIENLPPNQYTFEFYNGSNFFNLKLDYSISVAPV